jgi:hypothetical protein
LAHLYFAHGATQLFQFGLARTRDDRGDVLLDIIPADFS